MPETLYLASFLHCQLNPLPVVRTIQNVSTRDYMSAGLISIEGILEMRPE